jgi:hypothetical protein
MTFDHWFKYRFDVKGCTSKKCIVITAPDIDRATGFVKMVLKRAECLESQYIDVNEMDHQWVSSYFIFICSTPWLIDGLENLDNYYSTILLQCEQGLKNCAPKKCNVRVYTFTYM